MERFGRRWDRWDAVVAAAAVTLLVVSNQPWFAIGTYRSVSIWTAWDPSQWSQAVVLGMMAAGIHLAYRGRPKARGAAWLALVLLLGGLGLTGWQWHQAVNTKIEAGVMYIKSGSPGFLDVQDLYRSDPLWGLYAGTGCLILMFAAIARGLVRSRPRRTSAS